MGISTKRLLERVWRERRVLADDEHGVGDLSVLVLLRVKSKRLRDALGRSAVEIDFRLGRLLLREELLKRRREDGRRRGTSAAPDTALEVEGAEVRGAFAAPLLEERGIRHVELAAHKRHNAGALGNQDRSRGDGVGVGPPRAAARVVLHHVAELRIGNRGSCPVR